MSEYDTQRAAFHAAIGLKPEQLANAPCRFCKGSGVTVIFRTIEGRSELPCICKTVNPVTPPKVPGE